MFLNQLSDRQKASFLALATRTVMADGEITDGEKALIDALREEMGEVGPAPAEEIFGNVDLEAIFDERKIRVIVMLELMSLAFEDTDFHTDENHVLDDVGRTLGFTSDEIEEFRAWARLRASGDAEGSVLVGEATVLMGR